MYMPKALHLRNNEDPNTRALSLIARIASFAGLSLVICISLVVAGGLILFMFDNVHWVDGKSEAVFFGALSVIILLSILWRINKLKMPQDAINLEWVTVEGGRALLSFNGGKQQEFILADAVVKTGYSKPNHTAWVLFSGKHPMDNVYVIETKMPREQWQQLQRDLAAHLSEAYLDASPDPARN